MKITIPESIYEEMIGHAREGKPDEVCGILGGKEGVVAKHYTMTNAEKSPENYLMDPREQFAVVKDLRARGIEMLAIYHSHPHSPARPSRKDIDMAFYPDSLYIIISLESAEPRVKAFTIRNRIISEVEIEVTTD